jgi:mono/diheme cytochrome c family protein
LWAISPFLTLLLATPALAQSPDGQALFMANCAACHQPTGVGIKGAFPALAGDPFVKGDAELVIATVLQGRGGMPTFKADLDDGQIAAVLTYVRSAWGNGAAPVTPAAVADVRAKGPAAQARGLQAH